MYPSFFLLVLLFSLLFVVKFCQGCHGEGRIIVRKHTDSLAFYEEVALRPEKLQDATSIRIFDQDIPGICKGTIRDLPVESIFFFGTPIGVIEPGAFKNLSKLNHLAIVKCNLVEIRKGIFNELSVESLDLSRNDLSRIFPEAFAGMSKLNSLSLGDNKLTTIDSSWFQDCPKMYWINLNQNLLEELPEGIFGFNPEHRKALGINLKQNKIRKIHQRAFQNISRISWLHLDDNQLKDLPENMFLNVKYVNGLTLLKNNIKCLSDDVLNSFKFVKRIIISDIPGNCFESMKEWGKRNDNEIKVSSW